MVGERPRERWPEIAEDIASRVRSGELPLGAQLESVPALAQRYGVASATARKALSALKAAGTLRSAVGSGTYVSGPAPDRIEPGHDTVAELMRRVAALERRLDEHERGHD